MKKLLPAVLLIFGAMAIVFFSANGAKAAPVYSLYRSLIPEVNDTYYIGSTSPALEWKGIYTKDLTITGTCTGCGGAGGTFAWTPQTWGNSTSTTIGFLAGLLSNGSTTVTGTLHTDSQIVTTGNTIQFAGYSSSPQVYAGDSTTGLHFDGPGIISWHNGGVQTMLLSSTQRVGIATSSPFARLSIQANANDGTIIPTLFAIGSSTASATTTLFSVSNTGSIFTSLGTGFVGSNNGTLYNFATSSLYTGTTGQFPYFSGTNTITATSSLFLASSGNIGIGTTTPSSKLQVIASGNGFTTSAQTIASFQRSASSVTDAVVSIISGNAANALLYFGDTDSESSGRIIYNHSTNAFNIGTNGTSDDLTILSSGNVGIGTTSPSAKLTVNGSSYFAGALLATSTVQLTNYTSGALAADSTGTLYTFSTSTWRFASSTALADSNTFSGNNTFSNTITGSITGNAGTATALAGNGSNCAAGFFPLGVDASGASENCTYAFATTTPWATGLLAVSNTGQGYTIASSSIFGYTPEQPLTFNPPNIRTGNTVNWVGLATTSQPASSNLLVSNGGAGVFGVATTTVTCSGSVTCTQFTTLGSSPITITGSGGGTGLSTSTPISAGNVLAYSASAGGYAYGVATTTTGTAGSILSLNSAANTTIPYASTTAISSTNLNVSGTTVLGSGTGLLLTTTGTVSNYAGTSCTNQFVRSVSASGAATCATVSSSDVSLANLSATDSTLTFSGTYNGSTARTIGINLGNANTWTAAQTFNIGAGSPGILSNSLVGIGTTTPKWALTIASSTGAGLAITDASATSNIWTQRNINGNFYLATASPNTFATSTNSALSIIAGGFAGLFGFGTTSPFATVSIHAPAGVNPFAIGSTTSTLAWWDTLGKFNLKDVINGWTSINDGTKRLSFSSATTTTWTASTTSSGYSPIILPSFAGTIKTIRCYTDASFLGVNTQINGSNATPSYFVASTTVGKVTYTAGNTFTAGQPILLNFGTTTTATTKSISCTIDAIQTS